MSPVVIIGAGAQAKYAVEIFSLTGRKINAIFDPIGEMVGERLGALTVEAFPGAELLFPGDQFLACHPSGPEKEKLYREILAASLTPASATHPSAVIASTCQVGPGTIINPLAVLQPQARLGVGVMVHAGAIVEHDNILSDFCNVGPGVRLAGWVRIGRRARVCTGACVTPGVAVGDDAVVGAGAVVLDDVPDGVTVAGVPARKLSHA